MSDGALRLMQAAAVGVAVASALCLGRAAWDHVHKEPPPPAPLAEKAQLLVDSLHKGGGWRVSFSNKYGAYLEHEGGMRLSWHFPGDPQLEVKAGTVDVTESYSAADRQAIYLAASDWYAGERADSFSKAQRALRPPARGKKEKP